MIEAKSKLMNLTCELDGEWFYVVDDEGKSWGAFCSLHCAVAAIRVVRRLVKAGKLTESLVIKLPKGVN